MGRRDDRVRCRRLRARFSNLVKSDDGSAAFAGLAALADKTAGCAADQARAVVLSATVLCATVPSATVLVSSAMGCLAPRTSAGVATVIRPVTGWSTSLIDVISMGINAALLPL